MKNTFTPNQLQTYSNLFNVGFVLAFLVPFVVFLCVWHLTGAPNVWTLTPWLIAAVLRVMAVNFKAQADRERYKVQHFQTA